MIASVAKPLVSDLLQLGLTVTIRPRDGGEFQIEVEGTVDIATVAPLLTKYNVTAPLSKVLFL